LEHDWHITRVKEFDRVGSLLSTVFVGLDRNLDTESLEVDNNGENEHSGHKVHQVWQVLSVKGFLESAELVASAKEEMEEGDDRPFKFGTFLTVRKKGDTFSCVVCGRWERLPDNIFTDIRGNKKRDSRPEPITFLQEFVQQHGDKSSDAQLHDQKQRDTRSDVLWISIDSSPNSDDSLADSDNHGKNYALMVTTYAFESQRRGHDPPLGSNPPRW
jgi:hypothetical protein